VEGKLESTILKDATVCHRSPDFPSEREVRELLKAVLKGRDRKQIAVELKKLTGLPVTKRMLDDWCSPSRKGLRFPLSLARAVCQVTETDDLAFAAMRENLRERSELGGRLLEARDLLREMADRAEVLARKISKSKTAKNGGAVRR
jgi:hypothetical protein